MKRRLITVAFLIWAATFFHIGNVLAQEEDVEASPQEIEEAQESAQRFVSRMQQTRDVGALFDELFSADFISHFVSDDFVPPSLYSRLSHTERQRLFAAIYNLHYLSAVAIMSDHDDMKVVTGERKSNLKILLPHSTLVKIRRAFRLLGGEDNRMTSYRRFRILAEARAYLKEHEIERTAEFQRRLAPGNGLGTGIDYRVRTYIGGQNIKDCEPMAGFPKNQKFFRVELPLLIAAIFVRDGEQMKIVRLTYADGD